MKITWLKIAGFFVVALMASALVGCGDSSADLNEAYGLNDPENKRNPASPLVNIVTEAQQQFRSPESTPAMVTAQLMENIESFSVDSFGDHAADFETIKADIQTMADQAKSGASRSQLDELAQSIVDQATQLEQAMAATE